MSDQAGEPRLQRERERGNNRPLSESDTNFGTVGERDGFVIEMKRKNGPSGGPCSVRGLLLFTSHFNFFGPQYFYKTILKFINSLQTKVN